MATAATRALHRQLETAMNHPVQLVLVLLLLSGSAAAQDDVQMGGRLDPQPRPTGERFSQSPYLTITIVGIAGFEAEANVEERADYKFSTHVPRAVVDRGMTLVIKVDEVDSYIQDGFQKVVTPGTSSISTTLSDSQRRIPLKTDGQF